MMTTTRVATAVMPQTQKWATGWQAHLQRPPAPHHTLMMAGSQPQVPLMASGAGPPGETPATAFGLAAATAATPTAAATAVMPTAATSAAPATLIALAAGATTVAAATAIAAAAAADEVSAVAATTTTAAAPAVNTTTAAAASPAGRIAAATGTTTTAAPEVTAATSATAAAPAAAAARPANSRQLPPEWQRGLVLERQLQQQQGLQWNTGPRLRRHIPNLGIGDCFNNAWGHMSGTLALSAHSISEPASLRMRARLVDAASAFISGIPQQKKWAQLSSASPPGSAAPRFWAARARLLDLRWGTAASAADSAVHALQVELGQFLSINVHVPVVWWLLAAQLDRTAIMIWTVGPTSTPSNPATVPYSLAGEVTCIFDARDPSATAADCHFVLYHSNGYNTSVAYNTGVELNHFEYLASPQQ